MCYLLGFFQVRPHWGFWGRNGAQMVLSQLSHYGYQISVIFNQNFVFPNHLSYFLANGGVRARKGGFKTQNWGGPRGPNTVLAVVFESNQKILISFVYFVGNVLLTRIFPSLTSLGLLGPKWGPNFTFSIITLWISNQCNFQPKFRSSTPFIVIFNEWSSKG